MSRPILIDRASLSLAWADAFLSIRATPAHRLSPLTLSFTGLDGGEVTETENVRAALDAALAAADMQRVQTVANTIFPQSLWLHAGGDRRAFYAEYRANLPDYVAMEPHKNRKGLYFGRLTAFDMNAATGERLAYIPEGGILEGGNQLEFIIQHCKPGVRHSMFQASVFDPGRDHTAAAQVGFPCLQHVTFVPNFKAGGLELNAFYATQQLFEKGYGNFLGLARLRMFVASQVGLALGRVTCFVRIEKMEEKPKEGPELDSLVGACEEALGRGTGATAAGTH